MKKVSLFLGIALSILVFSNIVFAEVQSPIYTDDIGRSHFLGKGGYSTVRQINMQGMEANAVNDAIKKADDMMSEGMNAITGGINIPGLF